MQFLYLMPDISASNDQTRPEMEGSCSEKKGPYLTGFYSVIRETGDSRLTPCSNLFSPTLSMSLLETAEGESSGRISPYWVALDLADGVE